MINKCLLYISILFLVFSLNSCTKEKKIPQEILAIEASITIERFDQLFSNLNKESLDSLQSEYSFLFPVKYSQEFWIKKSKDTLQQEIIREISSSFPDIKIIENEIELLYKHLKFYYPAINIPKMSEQIVVDVANEYAKKIAPRSDGRDFMSQMILYGKRIYLLQKLLPKKSLASVFSYTENELVWNTNNESKIWRYFIEKELLYSTDRELLPRFLYPAPFSKFYMTYDRDSPDRVGQYIGYRIVDSFMKNNDVSLQELMAISSTIVFNQSRYKPKK